VPNDIRCLPDLGESSPSLPVCLYSYFGGIGSLEWFLLGIPSGLRECLKLERFLIGISPISEGFLVTD